jgi:hypothetical protein
LDKRKTEVLFKKEKRKKKRKEKGPGLPTLITAGDQLETGKTKTSKTRILIKTKLR